MNIIIYKSGDVFQLPHKTHSVLNKRNAQSIYDNDYKSHNIEKMKCGSCGSVGSWKPNTVYTRSIICNKEEVADPGFIEIQVYKCQCCKCEQPYHASLPDLFPPFMAYTYDFIGEIMNYYYNEASGNVSKTARQFNLSRQTVYRLIALVEKELNFISPTELFQKLPALLALLYGQVILENGLSFSSCFGYFFYKLVKANFSITDFLFDFNFKNGRAFLSSKTTYSHNGSERPYLFTPMGVNRIDRT